MSDLVVPADVEMFHAAVYWARNAKQLTLRELATRLGMSAPFLSDIEHGRRFPADVNKLEDALGLRRGELSSRSGKIDAKTKKFLNDHPRLVQELRERQKACQCPNCLVFR